MRECEECGGATWWEGCDENCTYYKKKTITYFFNPNTK